MLTDGERLVEGSARYYPATQAIIDSLREDASAGFSCLHGDGRADGIYEVPRGCIVFPGVETQALCVHHVMSDGSFEGMTFVVDLSPNAAWSAWIRSTPDYYMAEDPVTHMRTLVEFEVVAE